MGRPRIPEVSDAAVLLAAVSAAPPPCPTPPCLRHRRRSRTSSAIKSRAAKLESYYTTRGTVTPLLWGGNTLAIWATASDIATFVTTCGTISMSIQSQDPSRGLLRVLSTQYINFIQTCCTHGFCAVVTDWARRAKLLRKTPTAGMASRAL